MCNKNYRSINYKRGDIYHYRKYCTECGKKKKKAKRKSLNDLNKVIIALEEKGFEKEASTLNEIFLKIAKVK